MMRRMDSKAPQAQYLGAACRESMDAQWVHSHNIQTVAKFISRVSQQKLALVQVDMRHVESAYNWPNWACEEVKTGLHR